ncbi:MAG: hypothetical protein SFV18_09655 [Bryobacteraceae bacterium]|nr:hypothetical protein [Bryobacteraceae bacterium]
MLPEYDFASMKGRVRGKYAQRMMAETYIVLVDPDLRSAFPDSESVNRALRLLVAAGAEALRKPKSAAKPKRARRA